MIKHSAGPWTIDTEQNEKEQYIIRCQDNFPRAFVDEYNRAGNARLIAKAPEMYDVIKGIPEDLRHPNIVKLIREIEGE